MDAGVALADVVDVDWHEGAVHRTVAFPEQDRRVTQGIFGLAAHILIGVPHHALSAVKPISRMAVLRPRC